MNENFEFLRGKKKIKTKDKFLKTKWSSKK